MENWQLEDMTEEEYKEYSKNFTPPILEDVKKFFKENSYSEQSAIKAFYYYDEENWIDSKGNKVKNWKQKMRGVWFKQEDEVVIKPTSSLTL